jgi:hypothetical protein
MAEYKVLAKSEEKSGAVGRMDPASGRIIHDIKQPNAIWIGAVEIG